MADIEPHIIPSIYLANYLNDFEDVILNYEAEDADQKRQLSDTIWSDQ